MITDIVYVRYAALDLVYHIQGMYDESIYGGGAEGLPAEND
jgi:hypothetical protein